MALTAAYRTRNGDRTWSYLFLDRDPDKGPLHSVTWEFKTTNRFEEGSFVIALIVWPCGRIEGDEVDLAQTMAAIDGIRKGLPVPWSSSRYFKDLAIDSWGNLTGETYGSSVIRRFKVGGIRCEAKMTVKSAELNTGYWIASANCSLMHGGNGWFHGDLFTVNLKPKATKSCALKDAFDLLLADLQASSETISDELSAVRARVHKEIVLFAAGFGVQVNKKYVRNVSVNHTLPRGRQVLRVCEFCGEDFLAKHLRARFCKQAHKLAAHKQRKKEAVNGNH